MRVFDADAHAMEWEGVFGDKYFDPSFLERRPQVILIESDPVLPLRWLIDDKLFPRPIGKAPTFFPTPTSLNGKLVGFAAGKPESLESQELRGPWARLEQMDQEGIDLQVIYPTLFLAWPLSDDPIFGQGLCRSYNNWIADACAQADDRLKWVAVIDPADPQGAAKELERCKGMGAVGVMVLGMVGDRTIADSQFEPIWRAASELDLAVAVHVGFCCPPLDSMFTTIYDAATMPFVLSMVLAFEQILASGLLDRYPKLRVAFLEAGCQWVPFVVDRMEERINFSWNTGYQGSLKPTEYVRRGNIYFGFEVEEWLLPGCIEQYGADCWLYASDIPHADRLKSSAKVLQERRDISEESKRKLLLENCARFYKLPVRQEAVSR